MKKILLGLLTLLVLLVVVMTVKTVWHPSRQTKAPRAELARVDPEAVAQRLAKAIRFRTISHESPDKFDRRAFTGFRAYLEESFPLVHSDLGREVINDFSLLYTWPGKKPELAPLLLIAHMDVVPVEKGTESQWRQPPFGGHIKDGFIWGRGSLDDKVSLVGLLEAVETLLAKGFEPRRTILLGFGHDEEVGGARGAQALASLLEKRGVRPACVLDESGIIGRGLIPGLDPPVALVGVAEKGYLSVELTVETEGGHSSMPPKRSAAGILAAAVSKLEENQLPARLDGVTGLLFDYISPEMNLPLKAVFANKWLLSPLIKRQLSGARPTNAGIRTTTALTIFQAGEKDNVLPSRARAVVNFRIMPGDSVKKVLDHVQRTMGDPRIKTKPLGRPQEPTNVSDPDSPGFARLDKTIRQVFPRVLVAPYLVVAGTDARHYDKICPLVLRFLPVRMEAEDLARIHGTNERVSVDNYAEVVKFYIRFIENWNID